MLDWLSVVIAAIALVVSVIVFFDTVTGGPSRAAGEKAGPRLSWTATRSLDVEHIGSGRRSTRVPAADRGAGDPLRMPEMARRRRQHGSTTLVTRPGTTTPGWSRLTAALLEEYATMTGDDRSESSPAGRAEPGRGARSSRTGVTAAPCARRARGGCAGG